MVIPYFDNKNVVSNGTSIVAVELEPLKKNERLKLKHVSGKHQNIATTEGVEFYIKRGSTTYSFGLINPSIAGQHVGRQVDVWLSEGDVVGAYFPAAANTEIMTLAVMGRLFRANGKSDRIDS